MRISLAIKTLLRAPLKTLLTLALMVSVTFMLVNNVTDFAMTTREFNRAVESYHRTASAHESLSKGDPVG